VTRIQRLAKVAVHDWARLYPGALAAGCGSVMGLVDERSAAPDELVAVSLPRFARLGALAALCLRPQQATLPEPELAREAAAVLRLLDCALAAHGRDHGYDVTAWREHAVTNAYAVAADLLDDAPQMSLVELVEKSGAGVASVIIALHRDRLGVPEALAFAIGPLLLLYVYAAVADPLD
jgi:hypothetical protein